MWRRCRSPTARPSPTWRPNTAPTCGIFPIDDETLRYLRFTGRSAADVELVEAYAREQGFFHGPTTPEAEYSSVSDLDLASVEPSVAGPKRPQDRVSLFQTRKSFEDALPSLAKPKAKKKPAAADAPLDVDTNVGYAPASKPSPDVKNGSVVIAAITSCTNTSNPSVLVAAGLLAKKAVEKGLSTKPWVKTSLAPGSKVVTEYLAEAGLTPYLEQLKFHTVGYGCTTCIGNSGPLPQSVADAIDVGDLVVASVLSGNRNFEGRINPDVRANYLMSPPLVVAYALAGRIDIDLDKEPIGEGKNGAPVFLRDIWPSSNEVSEAVSKAVKPAMFQQTYAVVFEGDERWRKLDVPLGQTYAWDSASTYIKEPPYFDGITKTPGAVSDIKGARVLAVLGDSVTTDHISPAGNIKKDGPAGKYLSAHGVAVKDFNSYGARRGNHEVMVRGTFANVRLKNLLAPGTEGGVTRHLPDGALMSIFEASEKYAAEGVPLVDPRGQGIRKRIIARLGGEGAAAARRALRDRRELRAHPPQQPGRHGDRAARVPARRQRGVAGPDRRGGLRDGRPAGAAAGRVRGGPRADGARDGRRRQGEGDPHHRAHRYAAGDRLLPARRDPSLRAAPARIVT